MKQHGPTVIYYPITFLLTVWIEPAPHRSHVHNCCRRVSPVCTCSRPIIRQSCESPHFHFKISSCHVVLCLQGTRKFIISGFFITGIALFFVRPASFISTPLVLLLYTCNNVFHSRLHYCWIGSYGRWNTPGNCPRLF